MPTGKPSPAGKYPSVDPLPDQSCPSDPNRHALDRLAPAGWLVTAALTVMALSLLTLTVDAYRGISLRQNDAAALARVIGWNEPALAPSGQPARRPAWRPSPIDWRYMPVLPKQDPGVIPLLDQEHLTRPQAAWP